MMPKIAVFPGDGIGTEVVREAKRVLLRVGDLTGTSWEFEEELLGGASIDAHGIPMTEKALSVARAADAVLLGAVGGPKWDVLDFGIRPERALLGLRKELNLFANLRPAKIFAPLIDASTLKEDIIRDVDIMVVRELTGGIYFGEPRGVRMGDGGEEIGINTLVYTKSEIERVGRVAFEIARKRKGILTSVDKSNVLESTELWRKVITELHQYYRDVQLNHMLVDNCAMQLVRYPRQFDVIVTTNMFGDILSDEAAMLTGSIGMLPSASIGGDTGLYEPVHGSAPDIAGKDVANPLATILSCAMMLQYSFHMDDAAEKIEKAVNVVLEKGFRTADIKSPGSTVLSCSGVGDRVIDALESIYT
jgi:3-isopropylmalate dehydrogenase